MFSYLLREINEKKRKYDICKANVISYSFTSLKQYDFLNLNSIQIITYKSSRTTVINDISM